MVLVFIISFSSQDDNMAPGATGHGQQPSTSEQATCSQWEEKLNHDTESFTQEVLPRMSPGQIRAEDLKH